MLAVFVECLLGPFTEYVDVQCRWVQVGVRVLPCVPAVIGVSRSSEAISSALVDDGMGVLPT